MTLTSKNTVGYFFLNGDHPLRDTFFLLEHQTCVNFKLYSLRRLWRSRRVKIFFKDIRDVGTLEIRHLYTRARYIIHMV